MVQPAAPGGETVETIINIALFDALLFDLDGVITQSMGLHADSWKAMFDEFLSQGPPEDDEGTQAQPWQGPQARPREGPQPPFDIATDYRNYVDGLPRYDGVRGFLASRSMTLPDGDPSDPPDRRTVCGLGNRKNVVFQQLLAERGAEVYPASVDLLHTARAAGLLTAVVSSSKNCRLICEKSGLLPLFHTRVDGTHAEALGLPGKPAPDLFLHAAKELNVKPERAVVFEDALSGVEAGRNGGFGLVIGVDRLGQADDLRTHGADWVVRDLAEIALV